jgi:hypothetical protein
VLARREGLQSEQESHQRYGHRSQPARFHA